MNSKTTHASSTPPEAEAVSPRQVVSDYFEALAAQDLDRMVAAWKPGGVDRSSFGEVVAPDGIREVFGTMFAALPDWDLEVLSLIADGDEVAVHWRNRATFSGTAKFQGLAPNNKPVDIYGADIYRVAEGQIVCNHAYANIMVFAQQVGALPPPGSAQERFMQAAFNARTALKKRIGRR